MTSADQKSDLTMVTLKDGLMVEGVLTKTLTLRKIKPKDLIGIKLPKQEQEIDQGEMIETIFKLLARITQPQVSPIEIEELTMDDFEICTPAVLDALGKK